MTCRQNTSENPIDISKNRSFLEATLNAVTDAGIVICETGEVRLINIVAEQLFGYAADEIVGCNVNILMPSPQRENLTDNVRSYLETGQSKVAGIGRQVRVLAKTGETFPVFLTLSHFPTSEGSMFVAFMRDLRVEANLQSKLYTERQKSLQLQKDLSRVCRASTLSELASGIAHELSQPLAAISNYAAVGQRSLHTNPPDAALLKQAMTKISRQSIRAADTIKRLRALANHAEIPRQYLSMDQLITEIEDVIDTEAREAGCRVQWFISGNLPKIWACTAQIQHVVLLLVRNSLESMSEERFGPKKLQIHVNYTQQRVELSINDSGHGVNAEMVERMYYPFTTDKVGCLGISLSICKTIIRNYGGELWHKPIPSGGSQFVFTLPVHLEEDQNHGNS